MRTRIWVLGATAALSLALLSHLACAVEPVSLSTTTAGTINLKAHNVPLSELVRDLSQKFGLDLKGAPLSAEGVYLELTNCSLEDTLRWLLRGYNYVVMREDGPGTGSLLVLSRAERPVHADTSPPAMPVAVGTDTRAPTLLSRSMGGRGSVTLANQAPASSVVNSYALQAGGQQPYMASALPSLPQPSGVTGPTAGTAGVITLAPPAPPQIAGLDMPPIAPAVSTVSQPTAVSGSLQPRPQPDLPAPPQIPYNQSPQQPNAESLTPPQVPF